MQDPLKQGLKQSNSDFVKFIGADSNARSTKTRIETEISAMSRRNYADSNARSTKTRIETSRDSQKFRIVLYSNARSTKTRIETAHTVLSDHHSQKFECKIH